MRLPFRKGRRTQRICSFRGSFANRGNGMELRSSDAVVSGRSRSEPSSITETGVPVRLPFRKGRRSHRIWSFRGSFANRGSGMQLASSDAVVPGRSRSEPSSITETGVPERLPFRKGRRSQRIWSFRGSFANRGSGMQLASSDAVVPVVGLEPTRCRHRRILNPLRLPFHHTGLCTFHPVFRVYLLSI